MACSKFGFSVKRIRLMAKIPSKVVFGFDPDKSDIPALGSFVGRLLWACIRTNHIVSQYFDGNVQKVAVLLDKDKPANYAAFKRIISSSGLNVFGTHWVGGGNSFGGHTELDDEYWKGMWDYVTRKKVFEMEIKIE